MVAKVGKDPKINQIVDTLEIFTSNIGKLMAVFNDDGDRSDFCNGAIFGMNGSDMLIKISQSVLGGDADKNGDDDEEDEPVISEKANLKGKMGKAGKHKN